jgi:hypothetical protein
MYSAADPGAKTRRVNTGTYTIFPDPDSMNPDRIRLVCLDPNCNEAKILDSDSMNPDQKHSYLYLSADPDALTWRVLSSYYRIRIDLKYCIWIRIEYPYNANPQHWHYIIFI